MKMSAYKALGCMGTCGNITAEPTVDNTYRKITAIDTVAAERNCTVSIESNNIAGLPVGDYSVDMSIHAEGSQRIFEYRVFVNDTETLLTHSDKGEGHTTLQGALWLPENATVDVRQRSLDGGTALTINSMSLRLVRETDALAPSV